MSVIAKLKAVLSADTTQFKRGLDRAGKNSKSFQKNLGKTLKKAGQIMAGFVAGAVAALSLMTKGALKALDAQAKLARNLGISNDQFAAMSLVASEAGVAQDALGNAIRKSQVAIQNAERGLMTYKRGFDELGLSTKDLIGLSPDQQFEKIAVSLSGMTDKTKQITLAQEIFGKQGLAVIDMLSGYAEKVEEARQFNEKFGLSVSEIDTNKIEEANDAFDRVKIAVGGLGNIMAVQFAPILTSVSNAFLEGGVDAKTFGDGVKNGMAVAASAIDKVRRAVNGLKIVFNAVIISVSDLTVKVAVMLHDLNVAVVDSLNKIPGVSVEVSDSLLNIGYAAKRMSDNAKGGFNDAIKEAENFEKTIDKIEKIQSEAQKRSEKTQGKRTGVFNPVVLDDGITTPPIIKTKDKVAELKDEVSKTQDVMDDLGQKTSQVFEGIFDTVASGGNVFESLRDTALNSLRSIGGSLFKSGIQGILGSVGSSIFGNFALPSFATGSQMITRDTVARVHKGEAIIPAQQVKSMNAEQGGSVYNIDARGAEVGVEQRIKQVLMEVEQLRKDTPKIAVSSVQNANNRNLGFLK